MAKNSQPSYPVLSASVTGLFLPRPSQSRVVSQVHVNKQASKIHPKPNEPGPVRGAGTRITTEWVSWSSLTFNLTTGEAETAGPLSSRPVLSTEKPCLDKPPKPKIQKSNKHLWESHQLYLEHLIIKASLVNAELVA